jgi:hypothetical protein
MKIKAAGLFVLILLAASVPVRAQKNSGRPFFLGIQVTMNGAEIPAGTYEMTTESSKSNVRVTLWKDGQFVATAPGTWVKSGVKYVEDAVLLRVNSDGSRSIMELRLAGAARSILLNNANAVFQVRVK